ncbi:EAL domain-containing protein [Sulfurimonas lithotrophica]|uniref:EAL domain-containing protein n=1 Tax=Sulfurimonas lithotrophica TaxID=2590022 RepID=A0A5P8P0C3_9BACT|nr:GGDEF domain-containing phosphodiesterase [Sulfurimonas lithotrophica]QFR49158.1 EAL domain-containing protein [Sulfurimonas lithotrophica]
MYLSDTFNPLETIVNYTGALVYVIDLQNYEIIYANDRCKEEFGNVIGKTCYKVLQKDENSPCHFCPMQKNKNLLNLDIGTVYEWENKNSINGKTYLFNDRIVKWNDNRKVKIQIGLDITVQKNLEKKISKLAYYDTLTNLPNKDSLKVHIREAISDSKKNNKFNSILLLNIDDFKLVNDIKGHNVGDKILNETKKRIQECLEEHDILGRPGSDEFIILNKVNSQIRHDALHSTKNLAKKILKTLQNPYTINDYTFFMSASIGIVMFNDDTSSCLELINFADSALHNAKKNGKNGFSFFDPKLQEEIIEKAKLTDRIRHSIEHKEFSLYYQAQYSLEEEKKIIGLEALVRWIHPTKGVISPSSFIPVAEESGLIIKLGNWILEEAVKQLKSWENEQSKKNWRLSVNVSIRQFETDVFIQTLKAILDTYNINPKLLRLELTENLLIGNIDRALEKIFQLKNMGISISIDDFGTGYSSLAYLKALPIDELKIDQSFICDIVNNKNDEIITQTIISIGQKFGLDIIAEGVETQEQVTKLMMMGCNYFQGYFLHKPAKAELF